MSGSFINSTQNVSWILNQYRPVDEHYVATQSTPFASSSLAAVGENVLAMDYGKQEFGMKKMTEGVKANNIKLYSTDKPPLGVEWYALANARKVNIQPADPKLTVPNKFSLRRSTLL